LCSAIERLSTATRSAALISGLIIMIIQLTFYVQRNEFLSGFLLGKRAVIAALIVFMIALIIQKTKHRNSRKTTISNEQ
jgi:F0F1-type ATP synthase assembly protein I